MSERSTKIKNYRKQDEVTYVLSKNPLMTEQPKSQLEFMGFVYGFLGILIFSITLPATKMAISGGLSPVFVGLGRAIVAAILAVILLTVTRQPIPSWRYLPRFMIVVLGAVVGFPLLSALAMRDAPASYGAVITGLLPLATALFGTWRAGERPSWQFWIWAVAGSGLVVMFALFSGSGSFRWVDFAMLGAVFAASLGYAEGAMLSKKFGAWQVICWSLVLSAPMLLPIVWPHLPNAASVVTGKAIGGFLYVSIFSMFLGFFAWYHGLMLGGIARVGQLQLLQIFLTIPASAILLGEKISIEIIGFAIGVVCCVALGKRTPIKAKA
jgi:drug/metabolite transporter (DMT)-like permease